MPAPAIRALGKMLDRIRTEADSHADAIGMQAAIGRNPRPKLVLEINDAQRHAIVGVMLSISDARLMTGAVFPAAELTVIEPRTGSPFESLITAGANSAPNTQVLAERIFAPAAQVP